jgi:predicted transcriptional regulator
MPNHEVGMKIKAEKEALPVFAALHSQIRLEIIQLLAHRDMNIRQLAESTQVSSAVMTQHIRKLEKAGIVVSRPERGSAGTQKMCSLAVRSLEIDFPVKAEGDDRDPCKIIHVPVGHYSYIEAQPTCGLATSKKVIGQFDNPRYFFDPERVNASILWFTTGYVTYTFPNPLLAGEIPTGIEISLEICSEAPGYDENWPSDIVFSLNNVELGMWTSPGDFASKRGKYTPSWWLPNVNQYGLIKVIRVDEKGTYIDGEKLSDIGVAAVNSEDKTWNLTLSVDEHAVHPGGLTIFGQGFGNYDQDIMISIYYTTANRKTRKHK